MFACQALAWQKYDPDFHCPDSFIIWDKLETRKTKEHEILKHNISLEGTIPNGATEVENGNGKRLWDDANHLSPNEKKKRDCGLSYSPRKVQESWEESLGIHVTWHAERNVKH